MDARGQDRGSPLDVWCTLLIGAGLEQPEHLAAAAAAVAVSAAAATAAVGGGVRGVAAVGFALLSLLLLSIGGVVSFSGSVGMTLLVPFCGTAVTRHSRSMCVNIYIYIYIYIYV